LWGGAARKKAAIEDQRRFKKRSNILTAQHRTIKRSHSTRKKVKAQIQRKVNVEWEKWKKELLKNRGKAHLHNQPTADKSQSGSFSAGNTVQKQFKKKKNWGGGSTTAGVS